MQRIKKLYATGSKYTMKMFGKRWAIFTFDHCKIYIPVPVKVTTDKMIKILTWDIGHWQSFCLLRKNSDICQIFHQFFTPDLQAISWLPLWVTIPNGDFMI